MPSYSYGEPGNKVSLHKAGQKFLITTDSKLPLFCKKAKGTNNIVSVRLPGNRLLGVGAKLNRVCNDFPSKLVSKITELTDGGILIEIE